MSLIKAQTKVYSTFKSITGSRIVKFEISNNDKEPYVFLAIERGGETVAEAKKAWYILLRVMTRILQLKLSFVTAEMSHSGAKKKSNVLGKIVIPRINATIKYILSELEEKDREEFYRIKKIMKVKEKQNRKKLELAGLLRTPKQVEEEEVEEELPETPLPPSPPKARVSVQLPSPPPEPLPPTPPFKPSEETLSPPRAPPIEQEPTPSPKPLPTPSPKPVPAAKPIPLPPAPLPLPSKVCKICKLSMQSPSDPNLALPSACRVPLSISTVDLDENTCAICKRPLLKLPMLEQKISKIKPRLVPLQVETKEISKILRILKDGGIVFEEVKEIKIRTEHQLPQNVSDRLCRLKNNSACKMIQPFAGANPIRAAYCHQNAFIRTCTPSPYNNSILNGSLNYQHIASLTSLLKQYLGSTSEAWKSIEETSGIICEVNINRSCSTVGPRPISDMAVTENDLFKEGEGEDIHKNTDDIFRNSHRAIITEIEDEFTSPDSNGLSPLNDMDNKIESCTNNDECVKDTTILKTVTSDPKVNIIENEIKQLNLPNTEDLNNKEQ